MNFFGLRALDVRDESVGADVTGSVRPPVWLGVVAIMVVVVVVVVEVGVFASPVMD